MKMYSTAYVTLCKNDPENPLIKAIEAEREAQDAFNEATRVLLKAKEASREAENSLYADCMADARLAFEDKPFTAKEFEKAVGGRVSKHSIASMVAFAKTPKGVRVWKNEKFRLTERLLPTDLKDTGEYKKVERYFLPCDASGKPLEGSKPIKKISKGSRLYKFED